MLRARATDQFTTFSPFAIDGRAPSPRALTRSRCGGDELEHAQRFRTDAARARQQHGSMALSARVLCRCGGDGADAAATEATGARHRRHATVSSASLRSSWWGRAIGHVGAHRFDAVIVSAMIAAPTRDGMSDAPTGTVATKRRQASRRPPRGARSVLLLARRMYPSKFRHAIVFTVRSTCERVTLDVAHGMRREPHSRYWRAAPDSRVGTSWRSMDADLCVLSWTHTIPFHHRNSNPTRTPTPTIGSIHRHLR